MRLTDQQRAAVKNEGNTLLVACPGSGKTRAIVAKLLRCADEVRDTPRRVACITYTNAAVDEIDERLRAYGGSGDEDYCEVSTIHTFCLSNVLRSFHWKLNAYKSGFAILPSDSELFTALAEETLTEQDLPLSAVGDFENLNRAPDGTPIVAGGLTRAAAWSFWSKLSVLGYIDFANIVYESFRLLSDHPSIGHAMACRFAWILVDEFQDTSALQVEILKIIAASGRTRFFLVGDPYQSIYSFAGACPALMTEFADHIGAARDFQLLDNFRSSEPIIGHSERLLPRQPPMRASGPAQHYAEIPEHVPADTAFDAIIDVFLPKIDALTIPYGECAILAPSWFSLYRLGPLLREYGVPVYGVGARPYKKHHLFGLLAEPICAYIDSPSPEKIPPIEKGLFVMMAQATGDANYRLFSYETRVTIYRLLNAANELRAENEGGIDWLTAAAARFEQILTGADILPSRCLGLLAQSVNDIREDMLSRKVDINNLTVADLGLFANPKHNVKLLTIHQAKGREFDAVGVIDLHDGRIPNWRATSADEVEESKRQLYVAMTRARRILMYITDSSHHKNVPSRFIATVLDS
jgi:DNA helicase II / ATP-dependent DNA helicase PcrA